MRPPYRIREIAAQAGLSQATVDRVLHQRGGVRQSTVREVHQAIAELDRQHSGVRVAGPAFVIDVIAGAAVRAAVEAVSPALLPAVIRPRFHTGDPVEAVTRVARSHSQGLILDSPERPGLAEAVGRLTVPVVTLGADLPAGKRVAHVGLDPAQAGATAAYLVEQWLADRAGSVLVVGEPDARTDGFAAEMRTRAPNRRLLTATDDRAVRRVLTDHPSVRAVYSVPDAAGPAEQAIASRVVAAFGEAHRNYDVFVAHGLDAATADLLRTHRISAVLHHDRQADLRHACQTILQALGALPGPVLSASAAVQVITPFNVPPGL